MSDGHFTENATVMKVAMKRHALTVGRMKLVEMLKQVARHMVDAVEGAFSPVPPYESGGAGNDGFPVWRGHMRDSTGVAVYDSGKVMQYLPTSKAIKSQRYEGRKVIGQNELRVAVQEGLVHFSEGLWIVLFSAVPYAYEVNMEGSPWERGRGYFDEISEDFLKDILAGLKAVDL